MKAPTLYPISPIRVTTAYGRGVRSALRTIVLAVAALGLTSCAPRPAQEARNGSRRDTHPIESTFTFTVVPYEAAEQLNDDYTPMARYLGKAIGAKEGRFVSVVDYAGVLAALETGSVDVAYLSPFPYALAMSRMKLKPIPLAMPWVLGNLMYRGVIFTRADSGIKTLADLKNKTFAFGDVTSTTGFLLPKVMLMRAGVFDTLKWRNAGNANMVAKAVENGAADAGAAYESVFQVVYRDEPEKTKLMRVIGHTDSIPNGIYVARGDLPNDTVKKLREAFLRMNSDPEGRKVMQRATNDKIVPVKDELFDPVRKAATALNLELEALEKKD